MGIIRSRCLTASGACDRYNVCPRLLSGYEMREAMDEFPVTRRELNRVRPGAFQHRLCPATHLTSPLHRLPIELGNIVLAET
jgi:hypothetical protein